MVGRGWHGGAGMRRCGGVLLGLILSATPALAGPDCGCEQFDSLQQELDNAIKLRDRHRAKAEEMERRERAGESASRLREAYSNWEKNPRDGAGASLVATTASQQAAINFAPRGARLIENGTLSGWSKTVQRENGVRLSGSYGAKLSIICPPPK